MGLLGGVPVLFLFQVGLNSFITMTEIEEIKKFIDVKLVGVNHIGLCPYHNEKSPSFVISTSKGVFKCFGCGKGGTLKELIEYLKNR